MSSQALLIALIGAAILLRAIFVAAEAALIGVSPERADELRAARNTASTRALRRLKTDIEGSFAATRAGSLLGLTLGAGAVTTFLLQSPIWMEGALSRLLPAWASLVTVGVGGALATFCCLLVDTVARSLAIAAPERWSMRIALPLRLLSLLIAPPARSIRDLLDRLLAPFGARATFRAADPALEDIERILVQEASEDEDAPAPELVHSLFEFPTLTVRDVMIPRTDVVAIPLRIRPEGLVELLAEKGHSRLPVYDVHIDHIVGILHTRDVVPLLAHPELINLSDVIRPAIFVPWAKRVGRLLQEMQKERLHMAMVSDEHGGFMGIVTLEDILEELVGGIPFANGDPLAAAIEVDAAGGHLVHAGITMADFNERFAANLPEHAQFGTLGGFLNHLAGEIPDVGAILESHGLSFTVAERGPTKVMRVRVAPRGPYEESER